MLTRVQAAGSPEQAGYRNLLLLAQLRWLAVAGQLGTILFVHYGLGVDLPLGPMVAVALGLVALNLVTPALLRRATIENRTLFLALLVDFSSLTAQLYFSGGANNPFVSLYLLQVVLGAILLEAWTSWALVALSGAAFAALTVVHRPFVLPEAYRSVLAPSYIFASWLNFMLVAVLLVLFVTRVAANLRARDDHLHAMRERAAEEEQIVRMGLLASGAAHELGTPLASLAVIAADLTNDRVFANDERLSAELADMRAEIARCKEIVSGILFAAGEVTGQAPRRTTIRAFLAGVVETWRISRDCLLVHEDRLDDDVAIVADKALAQTITSLLDNAAEAEASRIVLAVEVRNAQLRIAVRDNGTGFAEGMIDAVGTPYRSSKDRRGAGLGLFLAVNTLRTLGGHVEARNRGEGEGDGGGGRGAEVTLTLPLHALALTDGA